MKRIIERSELVELARELGVRPDWHEPDEQEVTAEVHGQNFDNAGFWPEPFAHVPEFERADLHTESHVILKKDGVAVAAVNLATLFSWAARP